MASKGGCSFKEIKEIKEIKEVKGVKELKRRPSVVAPVDGALY